VVPHLAMVQGGHATWTAHDQLLHLGRQNLGQPGGPIAFFEGQPQTDAQAAEEIAQGSGLCSHCSFHDEPTSAVPNCNRRGGRVHIHTDILEVVHRVLLSGKVLSANKTYPNRGTLSSCVPFVPRVP